MGKVSVRGTRIIEMRPSAYNGKPVPWVLTDWFCTKCGNKTCWQEEDEGDDYYVGCSVTCGVCNHTQYCMDKWEDKDATI
jgi:hypothetical protein